MNPKYCSSILLLLVGRGVLGSDFSDLYEERDIVLFGMPDFADGVSYSITGQMDVAFTMDFMGTLLMSMEGTQELSVSAPLPEGGREIDIVVTHVAMHMSGGMMDFDFDTDDDSDVAIPGFESFDSLLGKTTILVDDDGNLVSIMTESTDGDGEINNNAEFDEEVDEAKVETAGLAGLADESSSFPDKSSISSPYQMVTRLARVLLPESPVKPNDTWEVVDDMDGLGSVSGTATFLGYDTYNGHDVAVILLDATIEIHLGDAMNAGLIDTDMLGPGGGITVNDANVTSVMYWDNVDKLMRWMQSNQTIIMEMPDPFNETSTLIVPISQNFTISVDIIA